ncbi:PAS domain-containing protein [bacterium]|nr:PAS domain-containing protein [bacterium]
MDLNTTFQNLTLPNLLDEHVPTSKKEFFSYTQEQIESFKHTFETLVHFEDKKLEKPLTSLEQTFNSYHPYLLELAYYKKTGDDKNETDPEEIERLNKLSNKVLGLEKNLREGISAIIDIIEKEQHETAESALEHNNLTKKYDLLWSLSFGIIFLAIPIILHKKLFNPLLNLQSISNNIKQGKWSEKYKKATGLNEIKFIQQSLIDTGEKLLEGESQGNIVNFLNNQVLANSVILRRDLRISQIGTKAAKLLGYTPEELQSKPITTILRTTNPEILEQAHNYEKGNEIQCELVRKTGQTYPWIIEPYTYKENDKLKYVYLVLKPPKALPKNESELKYMKAIEKLNASNVRFRNENEKMQKKLLEMENMNGKELPLVEMNRAVTKWLEHFLATCGQIITARTRFDITTGDELLNIDSFNLALSHAASDILDRSSHQSLHIETCYITIEPNSKNNLAGDYKVIMISNSMTNFELTKGTLKAVNAKWAQNFAHSQTNAAVYSNGNPNNMIYVFYFQTEQHTSEMESAELIH